MIIINKKPLTLLQYAEAHNIDLIVKKSDGLNSFVAKLKGAEYKDADMNCTLVSYWGRGTTPSRAIKDLSEQISGKILIRHAYSDLRTSIAIPNLKF